MCCEPVRCGYCGRRVESDGEEYCKECGPLLKAVKAATRTPEHPDPIKESPLMAKWRVQYQGPDKKMQSTYVTVPDDKYKTALEVQNAIEKGEVADLHVVPGAIVLVQKSDTMSVHLSRG